LLESLTDVKSSETCGCAGVEDKRPSVGVL
jgi:hypothetical protein